MPDYNPFTRQPWDQSHLQFSGGVPTVYSPTSLPGGPGGRAQAAEQEALPPRGPNPFLQGDYPLTTLGSRVNTPVGPAGGGGSLSSLLSPGQPIGKAAGKAAGNKFSDFAASKVGQKFLGSGVGKALFTKGGGLAGKLASKGGILGKIGKAKNPTPWGLGGTAAGILGDAISKKYAKTGGFIGGAGKGAATGATIGSIVPGVGTAIGGIVGGAIGGLKGLFAGKKKLKEKKAAEAAAKAQGFDPNKMTKDNFDPYNNATYNYLVYQGPRDMSGGYATDWAKYGLGS